MLSGKPANGPIDEIKQWPVGFGKASIKLALRKRNLGPIDLHPRDIVLAAFYKVGAIAGTIDGDLALSATTD
jgi:hypothetical protein